MSGANAIHGIILVGAIIVASKSTSSLETILSVMAVLLATINMVGGFVVSDRMLEMFKGKAKK
jgi:NAD(P) transhydrogenase subunit alpha